MNQKLKTGLLVTGFCLLFALTGYNLKNNAEKKLFSEEALLRNIPVFEETAYNRFSFSMNLTADGARDRSIALSGTAEMDPDTTHLRYAAKGKELTEQWTDASLAMSYEDDGSGWLVKEIKNPDAVKELSAAINNRDKGRMLTRDKNKCTLSWAFPVDTTRLFSAFLSEQETLSGYGRMTAVFDPETGAFEYFTVVITAGNRTTAALDGVLEWKEQNIPEKTLSVPEEVSGSAYEASTGIHTDGGYDKTVNPVAEALMREFGGTADLVRYGDGAALFWTMKGDTYSATVNYVTGKERADRFDSDDDFLRSVYGDPVEETENERYFYDAGSGELVYLTLTDTCYAEIIITGSGEMTQSDLRTPLVSYKAVLEI